MRKENPLELAFLEVAIALVEMEREHSAAGRAEEAAGAVRALGYLQQAWKLAEQIHEAPKKPALPRAGLSLSQVGGAWLALTQGLLRN